MKDTLYSSLVHALVLGSLQPSPLLALELQIALSALALEEFPSDIEICIHKAAKDTYRNLPSVLLLKLDALNIETITAVATPSLKGSKDRYSREQCRLYGQPGSRIHFQRRGLLAGLRNQPSQYMSRYQTLLTTSARQSKRFEDYNQYLLHSVS